MNNSQYGRRKGKWMKSYETHLSIRDDYSPGRIDWNLAVYLHGQGNTPAEAAKKVNQPFLDQQGVES